MGEETRLKSQRLSNSRPHPRPHKSAGAPCEMGFISLHPGWASRAPAHPPRSSKPHHGGGVCVDVTTRP